jgi:hypothetical protein
MPRFGDKDQAFTWLQKAVDTRRVAVMLKTDPTLDNLRSDQRFRDVLQRMGLSPE